MPSVIKLSKQESFDYDCGTQLSLIDQPLTVPLRHERARVETYACADQGKNGLSDVTLEVTAAQSSSEYLTIYQHHQQHSHSALHVHVASTCAPDENSSLLPELYSGGQTILPIDGSDRLDEYIVTCTNSIHISLLCHQQRLCHSMDIMNGVRLCCPQMLMDSPYTNKT